MKKLICLALVLLSIPVFAQEENASPEVKQKKNNFIEKTLNRFRDPDKGKTVFVPKGSRSLGIAGGFRSFAVGGEADNDGFAILSMLNIGNGKLYTYNVSPKFSFFLADDLALGGRLNYSGYTVDTDLKLDLRDYDLTNLTLSNRHLINNTWGGSLFLRKYLSFFGSERLGVFGEANLYAQYGRTHSAPIVNYKVDDKGKAVLDENNNKIPTDTPYPNNAKERISDNFSIGIKFAVGACYKLKDNSSFFVSLPLFGIGYSNTKQFKTNTGNTARLSQFNISRRIDLLGIQIGYARFIVPKKKK